MSDLVDPIVDLELIDAMLRLSTLALTSAPGCFPGQLSGRLASSSEPGIRKLLDSAKKHAPRPWFCPLTPSLSQAGGPLDRVFEVDIEVEDDVGIDEVATSPNGDWIAASSSEGVQVWSRETGNLVRTIKGGGACSLAFTLDGHQLVTGHCDGSVRIWDLESGRLNQRLERKNTTLPGTAPVTTLLGESVGSIACSPDGARIAWGSSDHAIRIWNLESDTFERMLLGHQDSVTKIAFCPNGTHIASVSLDATIRVWNAETGRSVQVLNARAGRLQALAIAPNGTQIVVGGQNSVLQVWNLRKGRLERTLQGHHPKRVATVAITPDGRYIVSGGGDEKVRVWDFDSGLQEGMLESSSSVGAVAVTPDGAQIISCGELDDKTIRVWRFGSWRSSDTDEGQCLLKRTIDSHREWIAHLPVPPNPSRIVYGKDKTVRVRDLGTGRSRQMLRSKCSAFAVLPDGIRIVSASSFYGDRTVGIWNLETGRCERVLGQFKTSVPAIVVTPDGVRAVCAWDESVRVWNIDSGQLERTLEGHASFVNGVAVTSDGARIVSGGDDGTVRAWSFESNEQLACWEVECGIKVLKVYCHMTDPAIFAYSDSRNSVHVLTLMEDRVPGPPVEPQVVMAIRELKRCKKRGLFRSILAKIGFG